MEPGESDEAAVVREVAEETGLSVTVGRLAGTVSRPAPTGVYEIHDYLCAATGERAVAGSDAAAVRWVNPDEFTALHEHGALVDLLAETLWEWGVLTSPA